MRFSNTRLLTSRLLIVGFLVAVVGCDSSEADGEEPLVEARATASLNGVPWSERSGADLAGSARFYCEDSVGLALNVSLGPESNQLYHQVLSLAAAYDGPGAYSLADPRDEEGRSYIETRYYEMDGENVFAEYSPTTDPAANQLQIASYDPEGTTEGIRELSEGNPNFEPAGIVEGIFRTTVVVNPEDTESSPVEMPRRQPDTLRFTEGQFQFGVVEFRNAVQECGASFSAR